jgi:hypothetical protein
MKNSFRATHGRSTFKYHSTNRTQAHWSLLPIIGLSANFPSLLELAERGWGKGGVNSFSRQGCHITRLQPWQNHAKYAHFPSGTDRNRARKFTHPIGLKARHVIARPEGPGNIGIISFPVCRTGTSQIQSHAQMIRNLKKLGGTNQNKVEWKRPQPGCRMQLALVLTNLPVLHPTQNHAKYAHFPSGTDRNQARKFMRPY